MASRSPARTRSRFGVEFRHRLYLSAAWIVVLTFIGWTFVSGFSYYRLDMGARVYAPGHALYRPSGTIGLRLGMIGVAFFLGLFVYPVRRHWRWLASIGKSKHWLDYHVLFGITAPLLITLHSSFKTRGMAGAAYWIMILVALSGFIGRYIYAQVPRSVNAAELSLSELQSLSSELAAQLRNESTIPWSDIEPVLALPSRETVQKLNLPASLWLMIRLDVARPFHVSRLRRRALTPRLRILTLGGFLPSGQPALERVIALVRRQSWISAKLLFLRRVREVFHLWHVIHRPFSYSFAVLVVTHIVLAILMGYY